MNLTDLNLNRHLYRDVQSGSPDSSLTSVNNVAPASSGGSSVPSPGSIITSVILQSSPSDDRIEINPDDTLKAYNNGNVVVEINKDGIFADYAEFDTVVIQNETVISQTVISETVETADIETLNVTTVFTYKGIQQPVLYTGVVSIAGVGNPLPSGWSTSLVSTGIYRITHNLNIGGPDTEDCFFFVAPLTGWFRSRIVYANANYVDIEWQQTSYGSRVFPVVGGGGGTVTVSQVRVAPYEEPVNVGFSFLAVRNLQ